MGVTRIVVPNQANFGDRRPGGAEGIRDEFWNQMGKNQATPGLQQGMGYANSQTGANAPQAQASVGLEQRADSGAGGNQKTAVGLAGSMARGGWTPAQAQLQQGFQGAQAQQAAMGRSARGSAAQAVAGSNAMANQAALQQQYTGQAQALRANEMAAGRGMYSGLLGQQQDQDLRRLGMDTQLQQQNSQIRDSYALGMGNAAVGIGGSLVGQSNQDLGLYQAGMAPINAQTDADQARQRWIAEAQKQKVAANMEDG